MHTFVRKCGQCEKLPSGFFARAQTIVKSLCFADVTRTDSQYTRNSKLKWIKPWICIKNAVFFTRAQSPLAALSASRSTNTTFVTLWLELTWTPRKENMQWFMNWKISTNTFHSQDTNRCAIRVRNQIRAVANFPQLYPHSMTALDAEVRWNFNELE